VNIRSLFRPVILASLAERAAASARAFRRLSGASIQQRLFASRVRSFYTDICGSSVCGVTVQLWFRLDGEV
jgi:hypothetical protein